MGSNESKDWAAAVSATSANLVNREMVRKLIEAGDAINAGLGWWKRAAARAVEINSQLTIEAGELRCELSELIEDYERAHARCRTLETALRALAGMDGH